MSMFDIAPPKPTIVAAPPPKPPPTQSAAAVAPSASAAPSAAPTATASASAPTTASAAPSATTSTSAAPSYTPTAEDRATDFKAVEGGAETRSGATLMVEAYAVLWLILLGWITMLWRKQGALHARLEGLERAIDKAADAAEKKK